MARIVNIFYDYWEKPKKYFSDRLEQLNVPICDLLLAFFGYSITESSETAGVIWVLKLGLIDDHWQVC